MRRQILHKTLATLTAATAAVAAQAEQVAYFPMEPTGRQIYENVTSDRFMIQGALAPMTVDGAKGSALRFDGYSNYITARLTNERFDESMTSMTVSLWCAVETYPIMAHDSETTERTVIAGNIDETAKTGFAFYLGRDGMYSFVCYSGGWKVTCQPSEKLPTYQWNNLVAVVDGSSRTATLYNNGVVVASSRCMNSVSMATGTFMIGRSADAVLSSSFMLNTFNGIIDEICIYDEALPESTITAQTAENDADLTIPQSRYDDDLMRPRFHGMPGMNWTNECHGLVKYDGKYHLFFQKNANGPYMSRLQWGHIVSTDLINWQEEPIALAADEDYDIKGCWSGCVFTDNDLTGGKPNIFYTAVDYSRAVISQAEPADDDLLEWTKLSGNPIVDGCPSGMSADFRDPYVFKADDGNYYMIVGTSQNNLGAVTLHRYDKQTKTWSNDGSTFFNAASQISGTFWEMPTVNKIDGSWLFTATPLETTVGVEVQYWIGSINSDGTFAASTTSPGKVELDGMSKDGFGLLSPAIADCDGTTIAMGIVPDKLSDSYNYQLGYAHTYSLPREWTISGGQLVQKPFSGLTALRTATAFSAGGTTLDGSVAMGDVEGRMVEVEGEFTIGLSTTSVGFELLKSGDKSLKLYYSRQENKMVVDMTTLDRWSNDTGVYDGLYESTLPKTISTGSALKIHAYLDHSILDVFVNDTWAFSVRVFATSSDATGVEAFADGATTATTLNAWTLSPDGGAGVTAVESDGEAKVYASGGKLHLRGFDGDCRVSVYSIDGRLISSFPASAGEAVAVDGKGVMIVRVAGDNFASTQKILMH